MTYQEKLTRSKTILDAINRLRNNEHIVVEYGTDYNNQPQRYQIKANFYASDKIPTSYSIHKDEVWAINGMNISSFTNTSAKAYTYDMMNQRTNYNFKLWAMTLVEEPNKE